MDIIITPPTEISYWGSSPGNWVEEYVIQPDFFSVAANVTFSTAFMAEVRWSVPTCLRYFNPQVLKDGRSIAGVIEQDGTPGSPGWVWRFYLTEKVTGPIEWRVETRDCAKVSYLDTNARKNAEAAARSAFAKAEAALSIKGTET